MISGKGSQSQKSSAVKDAKKDLAPIRGGGRPQSRPTSSTDLFPAVSPPNKVHLRDCHHFGPTARLSASVPSPLAKESLSIDYHYLFHHQVSNNIIIPYIKNRILLMIREKIYNKKDNNKI